MIIIIIIIIIIVTIIISYFYSTGIGAMGRHMAKHLQQQQCSLSNPLNIWNRNSDVSIQHSKEFGTKTIINITELSSCSILFTSLPTTTEVEECISLIKLEKNTIIIDTTSGDPSKTKELAQKLLNKGFNNTNNNTYNNNI